MSYRLKIHFIPNKCYGHNFRNISPSEWKKISLFVRSLNYCAGCLNPFKLSDLEAHEEWKFKNGKQKIKHIVPLCKNCHRSVHIGRALNCGEKYFKDAVQHFRKVNKLSKKEYKIAYDKAFYKYNVRFNKKYKFSSTIEDAWVIAKKDREQLESIIKNLKGL